MTKTSSTRKSRDEDNPEDPHAWKASVLRKADRLDEDEGTGKRTISTLAVTATPEFVQLLHRAAEARNMSLTSYAHRAISRQLAIDLDVPVREILALFFAPVPYASNGRPASNSRPVDSGEGHGEWLWP